VGGMEFGFDRLESWIVEVEEATVIAQRLIGIGDCYFLVGRGRSRVRDSPTIWSDQNEWDEWEKLRRGCTRTNPLGTAQEAWDHLVVVDREEYSH
jgi:hypothetical protein